MIITNKKLYKNKTIDNKNTRGMGRDGGDGARVRHTLSPKRECVFGKTAC